MLTRGYLIGEIVDDLANLASQVRMRNQLHLFDLTVATENFFRDFLNIVLHASLQNLNATRSNEPGLDLGDEAMEIGIQVTSSATSAKVNNTLEKITEGQAQKFKRIVVLGMNRRQKQYTIDATLKAKYGFDEGRDIWDPEALARMAFDLEIDDLHALYQLVRSNSARLKIELEVAGEDGTFPTSGYDFWEKPPEPKVGDGTKFCNWVEAENLDRPELIKVQQALNKLAADLSRLPRLTREFLAMLFERREEEGSSRRFKEGYEHLLYDKVKRQYRGDDLDGEIGILTHAGFVTVDGEDPYNYGPPEIGVRIPADSDDVLRLLFVAFVNAQKLSFQSVVGSANLSAF